MTTEMKPHIVLIPGAWHSGNAYDVLVSFLHEKDYETTSLTLPSVGAEPPLTTLDPEVDYIRTEIKSLLEQGKEVVVVMHSYGGFAGSAALRGLSKAERREQGLRGGLVALVYLAAWMLDEGQSVSGSGGGKGGKGGPSQIKVEGDHIYHLDPIPAMYHDVDPDLAKLHASRLKHHSLPLLRIPQIYAAWRYIPTTYLLCKEDRMIPYEKQLMVVEAADVPIETFTCDAGHSPYLSQPDLTSRVIRHAAGENIVVI